MTIPKMLRACAKNFVQGLGDRELREPDRTGESVRVALLHRTRSKREAKIIGRILYFLVTPANCYKLNPHHWQDRST